MSEIKITEMTMPKFRLWEKLKGKRKLLALEFELTARCNNNCRHCYINLPPNDQQAKKEELKLADIEKIADSAVSLGSLWCLLTGGEPLLRKDFFDIYLSLKRKGLLLSLFTNATMLTKEHISFLKKYPPRNIEISVYGVTRKTYEEVTQVKGSFKKFMQGMDLIKAGGLDVRLKAMIMRSNMHELEDIGKFCRRYTKDYYRFDPFLHLRYDGNLDRNKDISSERLSPAEIVALERSDMERFQALFKKCDDLIFARENSVNCRHLFSCRPGFSSCVVGYNGIYRLCSSLCHPDTTYDLRNGKLEDAFLNFVPRIHALCSDSEAFSKKCRSCDIINLCLWCPAHAYLEVQAMDTPVDYFCRVAHERKKMLTDRVS